MPADLRALTLDLVYESAWLAATLAELAEEQWQLPTPAAGWTIADQVSHLAYFDEATLASIRDPERFRREAAALTARGDDFPDQVAAEYRHLSPRSCSSGSGPVAGLSWPVMPTWTPGPGCPGTGSTWAPRRRSPPG